MVRLKHIHDKSETNLFFRKNTCTPPHINWLLAKTHPNSLFIHTVSQESTGDKSLVVTHCALICITHSCIVITVQEWSDCLLLLLLLQISQNINTDQWEALTSPTQVEVVYTMSGRQMFESPPYSLISLTASQSHYKSHIFTFFNVWIMSQITSVKGIWVNTLGVQSLVWIPWYICRGPPRALSEPPWQICRGPPRALSEPFSMSAEAPGA